MTKPKAPTFTSEPDENTLKLEWGFSPPSPRPVAYGARTIFSRRDGDVSIDVLWDRQCMVGGTPKERERFGRWLDAVAFPVIRKAVKARRIYGNDHDVVDLEVDHMHVCFSPRGSCGYLYIGVWPDSRFTSEPAGTMRT